MDSDAVELESWERPETPCSRKLDETCSKDYSVF